MKKTLKKLAISAIAILSLSACSISISQEEASNTLLKEMDQDIYGIVISKSTSKVHEFRLKIDQSLVKFYDERSFRDSEVTLYGTISIDDTIIKNKYISMTFDSVSYLDEKNMMVKLAKSQLIALDLPAVYSAYYADFETSLKSNINEVVGPEISSSPIYSFTEKERSGDFSFKMRNSDYHLVINKTKNQ